MFRVSFYLCAFGIGSSFKCTILEAREKVGGNSEFGSFAYRAQIPRRLYQLVFAHGHAGDLVSNDFRVAIDARIVTRSQKRRAR